MNPLVERRLLSKVAFDDSGECWEWRAARTGSGYGTLKVSGRMELAHRLMFKWFYNEDPVVVDHLCRNRSCVNPTHLRSVSVRVNALENNSSCYALNAAKTHCVHGHPFSPENTGRVWNATHQRWSRLCRTCRRAWDRKRRHGA